MERKKERTKNYASSQKIHTPIKRKRGHLVRKAPSPKKKEGRLVRIRRVAGRQGSRHLLISLKVRRMLKRTSAQAYEHSAQIGHEA